jgi:molybdopterin converting factor small subunit
LSKVKVVYFGQAREFAGTREDKIIVQGPLNLRRLIAEVVGTHPNLAKIKRIIQPLVNGRVVPEDTELRDGDRVAFLPPVAGG